MKFKPGNIISYNGRQLRVRQSTVVGFEGDLPSFYDLTDIETGQHFSIPISEVDTGVVVQYSKDAGEEHKAIQGEAATFVEHSNKTYWEQMEGKIEVSEGAKERFKQSVALHKAVQREIEEKLSWWSKLWK